MALDLFPDGRRWHRAPVRAGSCGRVRRGESGQGAAEHAGVIVVAVIVVLALAAAFTPLGGQIATGVRCAIEGIFSNTGSASCGTEPEPVTVGLPGGGSAAAPERGGGAQGPSQGGLPQKGPGQPADRAKVDEALRQVRDALKTGWFNPVSGGDLKRIERTLKGLNGAEVDAVIAGMSDDELRTWISEMEQERQLFGTGGWSTERRQQMWSQVLPNASYETVRRLAGLSNDIQPRFDDVNDNEPPGSNPPLPSYADIKNGKAVVNGVDPDDISQNSLGDCWYIASLKAVAQANPSIIENGITDHGNGSYTVRLYHDGKPVDITITSDQLVNDSGQPYGAGATDPTELWPVLYEKALASYWGSYGSIESNNAGLGLSIITGKESQAHRNDGSITAEDLQAALSSHGAVTLHSKPTPSAVNNDTNPSDYPDPLYRPRPQGADGNVLADRIRYGHAYYVQSINLGTPGDPSDDTVTVVNPWGPGYSQYVITMPYSDFQAAFPDVYVNATR